MCNREACKSILSFLSDVIDLPNSSDGGQYRKVINTIILHRGATLTRIMIAALTGALPSGRLEEVGCKILYFLSKNIWNVHENCVIALKRNYSGIFIIVCYICVHWSFVEIPYLASLCSITWCFLFLYQQLERHESTFSCCYKIFH